MGTPGFSLLYIYIYIYVHSVRCHSAFPPVFRGCVERLSSTQTYPQLSRRLVSRRARSHEAFSRAFPSHMVFSSSSSFFGRENGASPEMYFFFLNKKEGGEPVRGGDSRAVE